MSTDCSFCAGHLLRFPWAKPLTTSRRAPSRRLFVRLPADRLVGEFTDQVGVPVVAGVLLDHVDVDPSQGARFTASGQPGVAETAGGGCLPARLAFGLPCRQVGVPVSTVERDHLAVFDGGVVPDVGRTWLPLEDPPEPG